MKTYRCLKKNIFIHDNWSLVPLREKDIMNIIKWRNAQMDVLRQQRIISPEQQISYYREKIHPCFLEDQPQQILFSYLENNICVGYGGLTNIDWFSKRVELSFLINPVVKESDEKYSILFSQFINLIFQVVFDDLEFNRIYTETYNIRPLHISTLEKNGFFCEGRLKEHVLIKGCYTDSLIHGYLLKNYGKLKK